MIVTPIAIYRPRTRSVMLTSGDASIIVAADRAARLATALRRVSAMIVRGGTLGLRNASGRLALHGDQPIALANAIDEALALPAAVARLRMEWP